MAGQVVSGCFWLRLFFAFFDFLAERTPSYPHPRRAADHLEQQEEPHCKSSWNGNAHAMTLAVVTRCKGAADRDCGKKYRDTPPLQEQHGVQSDTRITIAVQRKLEAKCTPEMLKATAQ